MLLSIGFDSSWSLVQFLDDVGNPEIALFELFGDLEGEELETIENAIPSFILALPAVRSEAARHHRRMVSASQADVLLHVEGSGGVRLSAEKRAFVASSSTEPAAVAKPAWSCEGKWPTKLRRTELGGENQRQGAEDAKRLGAVAAAAEIIREAGLPLAELAKASSDPEAVLQRVGQGRRYRTIQKRVASWLKAREWFCITFGRPWPESAAQVLAYLEARVGEPCPRSVLWSLNSALVFLEKGGGVKERDQISRDPTLRSGIEEMSMQLGSIGSKPRRKAPRVPLAMLVAWERAVVDDSLPSYDRMFAWWQAVRIWGSLRFDDHRGVDPSSLVLRDGALHGLLSRTKTSGKDKKVEGLPLHVSSGAYLVHPTWLAIGFSLWAEAPQKRDFFLALPTSDRQGVRLIEATYADSMAMSRVLLASFSAASLSDGCLEKRDAPLFSQSALDFWTEHSARSSLPSWIACLAVFPSEWPDLLGRWGASRAEGYVRTHKKRVTLMQDAFATKFREAVDPHLVFGEDDLFADLGSFLRVRGASSEAIEIQIANLRLASENLEPFSLPTPIADPPGDQTSDEEEMKIDTVSPLALADLEPVRDLKGKFVVSISGSVRRLHKVGECWRVPGQDYLRYEVFGDTLPAASSHTVRCKFCFKGDSFFSGGKGSKAPVPDSSSSSGSSSS